MKLSRLTLTATVFTAFLVTAGCDVEQVEEGEMPDIDVDADAGQLPDYEVVQTREGEMPDVDVDSTGGNLPEYDVEGPDVDVGTTDVEIEVPTVDIDLPDDEDEDDPGLQ